MRMRQPAKTAIVLLVAACGGGDGGTNPNTVFNPTSNTSISGNVTYASVNIPAGVTVTVTSDAVITVNGDYTQSGNVVAPCHGLTITATGLVTVTGNMSNDCTDPDAEGKDLIVIGRGGYSFTGGESVSSGDIWIMDGPDLSITTPHNTGARVRAPKDPAAATSYRCRLVGRTLRAQPLTKKKGANGTPKGFPGSSGTSRTSGCGQLLSGQTGGNLLVDGITMIGGSGADGGDGTSSNSTEAEGAVGQPPGALNLVSDEDIDMKGNNTLTLGNGGRGGNATGTPSAAGASASAKGGKGGDLKPKNFSSPVTIAAGGTLTVIGGLTINFGTAGAGGNATATGVTGAAGNPGQKGGDATANGGNGGDSEPWTLTASGSVVILVPPTVNGGTGGAGGASTKTPGKGGDGNAPGAAGGAGGNAAGRGGNGGKGQPSNLVAGGSRVVVTLASPGGAAGSATYTGAKGGDGVPKCPPTGGAGGRGGNADGGGGSPGAGNTLGAFGTVAINAGYGNGGDGKQGDGPRGEGGTNGVNLAPNATGIVAAPGSFLPGLMGPPCPPSLTYVSIAPQNQTVTTGSTFTTTHTFMRFIVTTPITVKVKDPNGIERGQGTVAGTSGTVGASLPTMATLGTGTWTATGSATGVADVSMNFMVNAVAPATTDVDLNTMPHTGSIVPFGTHTLDLVLSSVIRGSIQVQTVTSTGTNYFWSNSAPSGLRVGSSDGNGYRWLLNTAIVDGNQYMAAGFGYCLRNKTGTGPVTINQRNSGLTILNTEMVASLPNGNAGPDCRWSTIVSNATSIEILAPPGGTIDFGTVQDWVRIP